MVWVRTLVRARTLAVLAVVAFGWLGLRGAATPLPSRSAAPQIATVRQFDRRSLHTVVVQGFDPGKAAGLGTLDHRAEVVFDDTHTLFR